MENLTLEEQRLLQGELSNGESLLWVGRPNPRILFHAEDWFQIPFSLLWGSFAIFWERGVTSEGWSFGIVWGIPFVLIGQYFIWGRFLYAAWRKRRMLYAITNERILVFVRPPRPKVIAQYLRSTPGVTKSVRSDGIGTVRFGQAENPWTTRGSRQMDDLYLKSTVPVFVDVDDADSVAAIANDLLRRLASISHN